MTAHRTALPCPRCATGVAPPPNLYVGSAGGLILHACGACGGVFLGPACATRLAEKLPHHALQLATQVSDGARVRAPTEAPLRCPACDAPMHRRPIARAGVELDTCDRHGTWYDRDELTKVASAIRSSGWGAPIEVAGLGVGAAAGAAALGAPAAGSPTMDQVNAGLADVAGVTAEVALEVGAESVFEVVFGLLGAIFD